MDTPIEITLASPRFWIAMSPMLVLMIYGTLFIHAQKLHREDRKKQQLKDNT